MILHLSDMEEALVSEPLGKMLSILSEKSEIRDFQKDNELEISFADMIIYPLQYQVYIKGVKIKLSAHEFDILLLLASSPGQVFSKEQIYEAVWKQEPISFESAVMCCISQLRKKIETNPRKPKYIQTIYGAGYRFIAPEE